MTLHDKWLEAEAKAVNVFQSATLSGPSVVVKMTKDGLHIETRSPSGTNDIVRDMYLTKEQAKCVAEAYERFFK